MSTSAEPEIASPESEYSSSEPEHEYVSTEPESENVPVAEYFSDSEIAGWITIYTAWIALILVLNIATIVSLLKSKISMKKFSNMFLLSLIIARTAVAILVMPARITGLFSNEALGQVLCKLCHFSGQGSSAASVISTSAVAVAKYTEVKYQAVNKDMKKSVLAVVVIWVAGYLYGLRAYFLNGLVLVNTEAGSIWACSADPGMRTLNQAFIFIDLVVMFVLPLVIVLVCYCNVMKTLNAGLENKLFALNKKNDQKRTSTSSVDTDRQKVEEEREKINSIKMLIGVMMAFIVCYAAVYIWKVYVFFSKITIFSNQFLTIEQVVYLISYANPWVNVFLYISFRKDIRSHFCSALRKNNKALVDPNFHTNKTKT